MAYTAFDKFVAWCRFRAAWPHVRPGSRVCDIGCGLNARFLTWGRERIRFGVGLDNQLGMGGRTDLHIVQTDIQAGLPVGSEQFDHAILLAVFEHLDQPERVLEEIHRILAPGGSLIMTWPNAAVDPILNVLHGVRIVSNEMESEKHQARLPAARIEEMLRQLGFDRFHHRTFEFGLNNLLVAGKPARAGD